MSCTQKRVFGIDLVDEDGADLSATWADAREKPGVLVFVGRKLLRSIIFRRSLRRYFSDAAHRVVPVENSVSRNIRLATGCQVGPFREFQSLVRLLARSEESGASVYLLGRTAGGLQQIEQNVRATFPGVRVVGRAVFHPASIDSVTTAIKKAAPRLVLSEVTTKPFFRWVLTSADRIGPVLTVISPRGLGRMAGRLQPFPIGEVLFFPGRLLVPVALVIHRLRAWRRSKKSPS
ncbi:MAG: WecB/TagA/CpsF family glycosyltransferase [Spirochaeta sp.]|jgi:UDP-N-acetyl-D-mannosaminuronic acid transferase (WecB/TagA/CpsF family)|nr:WecB/TagA/CpsF family glycosyltransferase [Spirochaeta sp.]